METPAGYQPEKPALTREQVIEELLRCAEEFPTMPVSHLVAQRLGGIDRVRQLVSTRTLRFQGEIIGTIDSFKIDGVEVEVVDGLSRMFNIPRSPGDE